MKKQPARRSVSLPSKTVRSLQPQQLPQAPQAPQTLAATSDVSKQIDEALEHERAITRSLDAEIADVRAKISQQQLQQASVGARPSLRWNLVPDERIISPRRSRFKGLSTRPYRSPSRQALPLLGPAITGPYTSGDPGQAVALSGHQQPSLTSLRLLPPTADTQNYRNVSAQGPQFTVPNTGLVGSSTPSIQALPTTVPLSGVQQPPLPPVRLHPSLINTPPVQALPTPHTQNQRRLADSGTAPGLLGPRTSGQILPPNDRGAASTGPGMPW